MAMSKFSKSATALPPRGPTCGVTIVTRTITARQIAEQLPNLNSRKRSGKKYLAFLFEEINALKRHLKPEKSASSKQNTKEGWTILSTEINLNTSSDEGEKQEYLFTSSKPFSSRKTKLAKSSHPTTGLVVSLIVNNEEHLLRALADTVASSSIILEAYNSAPFIKTDDNNTTTWSIKGAKFTKTKMGYSCDIFTPRVQSQETNVSFLGISCKLLFWVVKHIWYDYGPRSPWRIRHHHELQ
jgi:hypothetical protein